MLLGVLMTNSASRTPSEPDWTKLPDEFHYLIEATTDLSGHCGQADEFSPTDEEINLMERTCKQLRSRGGAEKVVDWMLDHEEFSIVGRVIALMEQMGFEVS